MGASGGAGGAGQAGAGGNAAAGTGGSGPLVCPVEATVLHSLTGATSLYLDLQTNGAVVVFLTSEAKQHFYLRTATLAVEQAAMIPGPFNRTIDALRLSQSTMVFVSGGFVHFSTGQSGDPLCKGDAPDWSLVLPSCSAPNRRFAFNGSALAMSGCGSIQSVGPIGTVCGKDVWVDSQIPAVGAADETLGLALGTSLFTVERLGGTYTVREKSFQTPEKVKEFPTDSELAVVTGGDPAGAALQGTFLYTSVRATATGKWDLRRYKIGAKTQVPEILYSGIDGLTAFALTDDGRVVWARKGGILGAGATLWRGASGGEVNGGPPTLIGCAPIPPTNITVTPSYLFFADATPPEGAPPSLRGVALPP